MYRISYYQIKRSSEIAFTFTIPIGHITFHISYKPGLAFTCPTITPWLPPFKKTETVPPRISTLYYTSLFGCPTFPQSIRPCVQNLHMSAPPCVQNITGGVLGRQTVQRLATQVNCYSQEKEASQLAVTTDHWLLPIGYCPLATDI